MYGSPLDFVSRNEFIMWNNFWISLFPVDNNRVVLNPCKDYRPSARGYINASFITVVLCGIKFSFCLSKTFLYIVESIFLIVHECHFVNADFSIWKRLSVHSHTRSTTTHIWRFLGNGTPESLPSDCDAYSAGRQLQGNYVDFKVVFM